MYINDDMLLHIRHYPVVQNKLKEIRQRLEHGVPPLTNKECRWLYFLVTGSQIPTRKRCLHCDGLGDCGNGRPCSTCGGEGYCDVA